MAVFQTSAQTSLSLLSRDRGPVNGGTDENNDGDVDGLEAFTSWDFSQILRVLKSGTEDQPYQWTNIDTCYQFGMIAGDFFEDESMPKFYQTCRNFTVTVATPTGQVIGSQSAKGCRNFATFEWGIY